jgi:hypothetical protein
MHNPAMHGANIKISMNIISPIVYITINDNLAILPSLIG